MNDKSLVKLGDVAHECRQTWNGDQNNVPIVGLEHLIPGEIELYSWDSNIEHTFSKKFVKGQVLLGRRRVYLKKAAVAPCDGICSGDITVIESTGGILPELLPFVIQNDRFFDYAMQGSAGSLSPRVKWEHLKNYEIPLPPLTEQKVLADKLWAAYRLKESYKKLLAATKEMVKSRFIEMFGTPENNHHKYPIIKIGDIVDSINYGTSKPATEKGKYVYLRMNNITYDGKLNLDEIKHIDLSPEEDENAFVQKGDLLFNRTNTKEFVGKTTVFQLVEPMVVAGYIIRVRFIKGYSPEYISGYLNSAYGKSLLRKMAKGAVHQANINAKEFQSIKVLDVPEEDQDRYKSILNQADKSGFELRKSVDAIDKVIKSVINEN